MKIGLKWVCELTRVQKAIGLVVISVLIMAVFISRRNGNTPQYDVYAVKRGDISENVVISGNANSAGSATVYSPSTGIVEEVLAANGDSIEQDQEIMRVKSTASEVDQSNALAAYETAVAALNTAKQSKFSTQSTLEAMRKAVIDAATARQQMIDRRNVGSVNPATDAPYTQNEIDSINSAYLSAAQSFSASEKKFLDSDQAISAAQSAASAAWLSYQATRNGIIKSPIAGKIMNISVGIGDYVKAKTALNDAPPLFRISTQDTITVSVKLNEIDVAKVHEGQRATVVFDALSNKKFEGAVSRVDSVGENINAVVTYNAYISLEANDDLLRPTMTSTVTIHTDAKKDVLLVPNSALQKEKESTVVLVKTSAGNVFKPVAIGMKNGELSEVLSGVTEQDVILIPKK